MRTWGIVALAATMAISSMASATDLSSTTVGLVGGNEGAGEAPLDLVDRPGIKLARSFRLRMEMSDRLDAVAHGVSSDRTMLVDRSRARRVASMIDYYPLGDSGFHLSAGMRKLPRLSRRPVMGGGAGSAFDLSALSATSSLGTRNSIARKSPTVTAGWTGMVAEEMQVGFSAGATQEHGKALSGDYGTIGAATRHWSRVGQVAQVNLAMRF